MVYRSQRLKNAMNTLLAHNDSLPEYVELLKELTDKWQLTADEVEAFNVILEDFQLRFQMVQKRRWATETRKKTW